MRNTCIAVCLLALALTLMMGCKPAATPPPPPTLSETPPPAAAPKIEATTKPVEAAKTDSSKPAAGEKAAPTAKPAPAAKKEKKVENETQGTTVKIKTQKGNILLELFDKKTPITAGNFLLLVKSGYYDGVVFHRVVPNFVIQGGDPTGTGAGGPGFTIPDEVRPDLKHDRGMLSMAKTALPNTGGSQFFIVTGGPETVGHLDMKHAVFGKVLEGMNVVDDIQPGDKMLSVTVVKESPDAKAAEEAAKKARVKK